MSPAPAPRVSNWNLPNALTVGRILLVPVFAWALLRHDGADPAWRWWAALLFLVAILTDRIDGDLARKWNLITNVGKILDPIADKALTGMAFLGLSIIGELPWWLTVLVLVREWGITLLRFAVIRHGVIPAGRGGKLKTTLQALGLGLLCLPLWTFPAEGVWRAVTWTILIISVVVTVVTGIDYVIKAITLRQKSPRTAMKRERRAALAAARAKEAAAEAAARARDAGQRARDAGQRARDAAARSREQRRGGEQFRSGEPRREGDLRQEGETRRVGDQEPESGHPRGTGAGR